MDWLCGIVRSGSGLGAVRGEICSWRYGWRAQGEREVGYGVVYPSNLTYDLRISASSLLVMPCVLHRTPYSSVYRLGGCLRCFIRLST